MPDEKRRQVPIAERGPGWTYRPVTDPGEHQPGVSTAHLEHAILAAYDGVPEDVIEAAKRHPGTVTIGFGARAFADGQRPLRLKDLPAFPGDELDPAICGGDLCVLICSDDAPPEPIGTPRWAQRGTRGDRGALGFREGTLNLRRPRDFDKYVWVTRNDRTSMIGGTYLVVPPDRGSRQLARPQPGRAGAGHRSAQAQRRAPDRPPPLRRADPRPAPGAQPHPPGGEVADPAPRLRHRGRPAVPRLHERPAAPIRPAPAAARRARRPAPSHAARRKCAVRGPSEQGASLR